MKKLNSLKQSEEQTVDLKNIQTNWLLKMLLMQDTKVQFRSLECLEAFTKRYPKQISSDVMQIATAIVPFLTSTDAEFSSMSLKIAFNLAVIDCSKCEPITLKSIEAVQNNSIPSDSLNSLSNFIKVVAEKGQISATVINSLQSQITINSKGSALILALVALKDKNQQNLKQQFVAKLQGNNSDQQIAGALCMGEYGKR